MRPFGCTTEIAVAAEATAAQRAEDPPGRFNRLGTSVNRSHPAFAELGEAWRTSASLGAFTSQVMNLPFYKALAFTLTSTGIGVPLVILLGLAIALRVNGLPKRLRGRSIFCRCCG